MVEARFCPRCGTPLKAQPVGERVRPVCPACGFIYYVNPIVAAGTLVDHAGRVLLIRRGVEPGLGAWGLPAGYGEAGETPEETALRETREEAGVEVALDGLLGIYPFGRVTPPSGVLILYAAHWVSGELRPGPEELEAAFFAPDALPAEIAFATHRQALAEWVRARAIQYGPPNAQQRAAVGRLAAEAGFPLASAGAESEADSDLLVASDKGQVVGWIAWTLEPAQALLRLQQLYVLPAYRRWGIGTRLLQATRVVAGEVRARRLLAEIPSNNPGLRLFMRSGFDVCGFLEGEPHATLLLCYDLGEPEAQSAGDA